MKLLTPLKIKLALILLLGTICVLTLKYSTITKAGFIEQWLLTYPKQSVFVKNVSADLFFNKLSDAAIERTKHKIRYVPDYISITYPMGDVPKDTGVCTDVLIRSYRMVGIDLQVEVHEDMKTNFIAYPKIWRLPKPDTNIDHRRVPNLMTFFKRNGIILPITRNDEEYSPGDIVAWDLGGNITHIGIVVDKKGENNRRFKIVHNIGNGPCLEDRLFDWKIIGHFKYDGSNNIREKKYN